MSNGIITESRSKQVSIKNLLTWNRILFSCVYIVHAVHLWGSYTHLKVKWGVIRCGQKNSNISGIISDEIIVFFIDCHMDIKENLTHHSSRAKNTSSGSIRNLL